ncbi:hypothetical protein [Phaeovulum sp.]|uniref:hypothetical protein n=1 Tax=Phaeovulum sp. TaxID=2934796 RepID=UPI0035694803
MLSHFLKLAGKPCLGVLFVLAWPAWAQGEREPIPEADLRTLLPFSQNDTLKYAHCEVKSYPTCTYVWGVPASDDDARVKLGAKPEGDRLTTIFAQAHGLNDFDRVLATYSDADPVEGLGIKAAWSAKRDQLSFMMADYLIIHVNIDARGVADPKAVALQTAMFLSSAN